MIIARMAGFAVIPALLLSGGCSVDASRNDPQAIAEAVRSTQAPATQAPAARDGAFIHIKSGPQQPHSVLMALSMANKMSADRDVLVYCDIDAVHAVVQGSPDLKMEPFGSSHTMIAELVAKGVPVYACPGCLKVAGLSPEQLLPGVKVADRAAFFGFTNGRILTLDY